MFDKFKRQIQPLINVYHLIKAYFASLVFGSPSRSLKVIGVTGTDGKTTTTFLIYQILKEAGKKVSMVSSVYAKIAGKEFPTGLHVTTPDAILVQKLLKMAKDAGDEYYVLETTSHALDQNRVWGIKFDTSVITNITNEHLDYHKSYDKYLKAKAKLLLMSKQSVINKDDDSFQTLEKILEENNKKYSSYGLKNDVDFNKDISKELDLGLSKFNNYNYLAAYSVSKLLGLSEQQILNGLKQAKLPQGRLEVVYDKDFKVIIDFAHTPNSFTSLLSHLKENVVSNDGRLIHVFGSAGLRDFKKRPLMGHESAKYADVIILTEEDYRTEDPLKISKEIATGLEKENFNEIESGKLNSQSRVYTTITGRQEAINKAVEIAQKGDVIVLTGKSHEQSLARGKKEYPWDEKRALLEALKD